MNDKKTAIVLTSVIIGVIGIAIIFFVTIGYFMGAFEKSYSISEMEEHFQNKHIEIYAVNEYIKSITPENTVVEIEFENDKISLFRLNYYSKYNLEIHSLETLEMLAKLGWTVENLHELKNKINKADCISAGVNQHTQIGFRRRVMEKYYFLLLNVKMTDSARINFNKQCFYYVYNDSVVFEYGGGAIGSNCFKELR